MSEVSSRASSTNPSPIRLAEATGYSSFSLAVHQKTRGERVPLSGTFELTRRCPLRCVHCYNNLPMGDRAARAEELTPQEIDRILGEAVDEGCLWLLLTGGEILARKDFFEIYRAAKQRGLLLTLFTNGVLIDERAADQLAEWRPFALEITLYGASRETYRAMTGRAGNFDLALRAIELLVARRIPLRLKTVATRQTVADIGAMQTLAQSYGLDFKFDALVGPRLDGGHGPLDTRLSALDVVRLDRGTPGRLESWKALTERFAPTPGAATRAPKYGCSGAKTTFAIDPEGRLGLCTLSEHERYDLRQGSFREGWQKFLGAIRARERAKLTRCETCALKALCGTCPASSYLETGDDEAPVDFFCEVAHLRAGLLDMVVPEHGDCPYCAGGARRPAITGALEQLAIEPANILMQSTTPASRPRLPVLNTQGGGESCQSCR